jgi:hypothetical protein
MKKSRIFYFNKERENKIIKNTLNLILISIVFLFIVLSAQAERLPVVSGDSDSWGTVLNNYLAVEHDQNGSHRNVTVYDSFKIVNVSNSVSLFYVNSTTGYIGIGTTSPDNPLQIVSSDVFSLKVDSTSSTGTKLMLNNSDAGHQYAIMTTASGNSEGPDKFLIRDDTKGVVRMTINGSNIGIGTTSPLNMLHIQSASGTRLVVDNTGTTGSGLNLSNSEGDREIVTNGDELQFIRDGTVQMVIDSSGKVGIGTTDPKTTLNVVGTLNVTDLASFVPYGDTGVIVRNDVAGGTYFLMEIDQNANSDADNGLRVDAARGVSAVTIFEALTAGTSRFLVRGDGNVGIGTANPATVLDVKGKANFTGNFTVGETSNILFVDNTSGRVGIGTTAPTAKLDVNGQSRIDSDGGGLILSRDAGTSPRDFRFAMGTGLGSAHDTLHIQAEATSGGDDFGSLVYITADGFMGILDISPDSSLEVVSNFSVSSSASGDGDRFIVDSSGNVGIGTTLPSTTLDAKGKANFTGNFTVGETSNILFVDNTSGRVGIGTNSPTNKLEINGGDVRILDSSSHLFLNDTDEGGTLRLERDGSGFNIELVSTNTNLFRVADSGNVGIGTTSPATVLDVKGKANFTGNFTVGETSNILFVDNTSGRVGIGTTTPSTLLDVNGNATLTSGLRLGSNTTIEFDKDNLGRTFIRGVNISGFASADLEMSSLRDINILLNSDDIGTNGLRIYKTNTTNTHIATFLDTGNVGINTTIPNATLHLTGSLNVSAQTRADTDLGVMPDGGIVMDNLLSASASTDLNINSNNELHKVTSSKRFKDNIRDIELDTNLLYNIKPRTFVWNNESGSFGQTDFGLIAEEVADIVPELVSFDSSNEPYSVKYQMITVLLLKEIQDLKKEIDVIKGGVNFADLQNINGSVIVKLG